jgi:hypothetical protein
VVEGAKKMIGSNKIEQNIINEFCSHPKLKRNKVWCRICGREEDVDSARCMKEGWPKCCGETMTIDSPEERRKN